MSENDQQRRRGSRRHGWKSILIDLEPIRRDREFRMLWLGQLVNNLGRQVTVVALPFELWQLTHSSRSIGVLALVQLVPILIFSLGGGAVADAVDRRKLLLATQAVLAATSVGLAALALQPNPPPSSPLYQQLAIGWGYATFEVGPIQADNAGGLTSGNCFKSSGSPHTTSFDM